MEQANRAARRVLAVDDNGIHRGALAGLLMGGGLEGTLATNGAQALDRRGAIQGRDFRHGAD